MGPRRSFFGVKRLGREADRSPPSSAEVKEWVELYFHSPSTSSWRGAQLKHRGNFTFFTPIMWRMQNICSVDGLLHQSPRWWSPIISSTYVRNHETRQLNILFVGCNSDHQLQGRPSWPVPVHNLFYETYESIRTFGRTSWTGDRPDARPLPLQDNTTQKNADTHPCLEWDCVIRTHDPSVRAAENSTCLRLRGHWDGLYQW
jgi:hypothetical protein